MTRTRIKICGVTSSADAAAAVEAGADAIGVIFAESPRRVTPALASEALAAVPPLVARVGVFVDATSAQVAEAVREAGLTAVQFSGTESPEECAEAPVPVIKVFHVNAEFTWAGVEPYRGSIAAALLDTASGAARGGTGVPFEWATIPSPPDWLPLLVAGGLDASNVAEAIFALRPFAVDVCSGVESVPGVKDVAKLAAFAAAVRSANERSEE